MIITKTSPQCWMDECEGGSTFLHHLLARDSCQMSTPETQRHMYNQLTSYQQVLPSTSNHRVCTPCFLRMKAVEYAICPPVVQNSSCDVGMRGGGRREERLPMSRFVSNKTFEYFYERVLSRQLRQTRLKLNATISTVYLRIEECLSGVLSSSPAVCSKRENSFTYLQIIQSVWQERLISKALSCPLQRVGPRVQETGERGTFTTCSPSETHNVSKSLRLLAEHRLECACTECSVIHLQ